jgi:radical SAM superfamily enzyme YgiQ (UPF0313 family)
MNLLLINPDYMRYSTPPLGLIALAAYVRRECPFFNLKLIDQVPEDEIIHQIKIFSPEIIGITAVSENYYFVKTLAEKIKNSFPKIILVIGGIHISTSPESFENSPFDLAVRGEGEIAFTKLLNSINKNIGINKKELRKIKGVMIRDGKKIIDNGLSEFIDNLDDLPLPARDLLNNSYYSLPTISAKTDFDPAGPMITSRGCPHNCSFCSSFALWGRRIRFFSAKRVVEEIEILYNEYKYKRIIFVDDVFTINKPRLREIITLLKNKPFFGKIKFSVLGRADTFDEETAMLLKELNVVSVTFGIETGSQKMLNYLKRGRIKVEDGITAIKTARKYGIMGGGFFMVGSPYETKEDMEKTYEFIKTYCKDDFAIHQTVPLPGTEVWEYALKNNIVKKDFYDYAQKDFVDIDSNLLLSKEISKEEFEKTFYKIKSLHVNKTRRDLLIKMKKLRVRHIILFLSPAFRKKTFNLRSRLVKKILNPKVR